MNKKTLTKLEYFKIIDMLTELASSPGGKTLCRELLPMTDLEKIRTAQEQTAAAFTRIIRKGRISFGGCTMIEDSLKRLEIGASLGCGELLRIGRLLETAKRAKSLGRRDTVDDTADCLDIYFEKLEPLTPLAMSILLRIGRLLETAKRAKSLGRRDTVDDTADCLDIYFEKLEPLTPLAMSISSCIIDEDEISDDASSTLKQIRRNINRVNDKIHSTLVHLVNGSMKSYLQDSLITMRGDRYCIPVKAEYRSQVSGMIHDQSSTGSTLFIEPMAVVNLNNDLKELYIKEQEEIAVILARLSSGMIHDQSSTGSTLFIEPMAVVNLNNDLKELYIKEQEEIAVILARLSEEAGEYVEELRLNYRILTDLDFIFARGQLAVNMNANLPIFNEEGRIHIREGRHPLLDKKKVVPITVRLGEDFDLLIITGPNTGGKTVSLKTVGLFTLMGQSGLHIPALARSELALFHQIYADIGDEQSIEQSLSTFSSHMTNIVSFLGDVHIPALARSELALFHQIYADIGDEQSIEQSLSTFSSHMTNIVSFLGDVDEHSLVLFDELGAGTDPTEGAALATAILSYLHNRGIRTMATTHYSELKVYALSTPGVENACCEFDVATLRPTYHLLIGVPGKIRTMATTHYSELKVYALSTPGVENACCEFDVATLRPTYHLLIGVPGKSNAFAISSRLGLPDYIIEDARKHLTEQDESFEDLLCPGKE